MTKQLIIGDCLQVLEEFSDKYFDYCLTSPPFKEQEWGGEKYWKNFDNLIELLRKKVSKCAFIFNSSTKIREMLNRYSDIERILIWGKAPSMYSYRYEPIFLFRFDKEFKPNKYIFKDYWQMSPILNNNKTYENPVKLYKELLLKFPKGKVLDPFFGTGTTGKACDELGLEYVGIEIKNRID